MAQVAKPVDINKVWAAEGERASPPDMKIADGWVKERPPLQYFNWLDNKQDASLAHINQRGIAAWDERTEYYALSSYCQGQTNGIVYRAKVNNVGQNPEVDDEKLFWDVAFANIDSPNFTGVPTAPTPSVVDNSDRIATTAYVRNAMEEVSPAAPIRKPFNITPANVSTGNDVATALTAGVYYSLYGIAHKATQVRVANDLNFLDVVRDVTLGPVITWTVSPILITERVYFWQIRYQDIENTWSEWSTPTQFSTGTAKINAPVFTFPLEGDTNLGISPQYTVDPFTVMNGVDTHYATDWEVRTGPNGTGLRKDWAYDYGVPFLYTMKFATRLDPATTYYIRARFKGAALGISEWGEVSFRTANNFYPTEIGEAWGGGYYAGQIKVGSKKYALIMAPRNGGEVTSGWYGSGEVYLEGQAGFRDTAYSRSAASYSDGKANTTVLQLGMANDPANSSFSVLYELNRVNNDSLSGYNDWYVPSKDELELLYRYFKPTTAANDTTKNTGAPYYHPSGFNGNSIPAAARYTNTYPQRTPLPLFQQGASEAVNGVYTGFFGNPGYLYVSSTVEIAPSETPKLFAFRQAMTDGEQNNAPNNLAIGITSVGLKFRFVRRIEIVD